MDTRAEYTMSLQQGQSQILWLRKGSWVVLSRGALRLSGPAVYVAQTRWQPSVRLQAEQAWVATESGTLHFTAEAACELALSLAPSPLSRWATQVQRIRQWGAHLFSRPSWMGSVLHR